MVLVACIHANLVKFAKERAMTESARANLAEVE